MNILNLLATEFLYISVVGDYDARQQTFKYLEELLDTEDGNTVPWHIKAAVHRLSTSQHLGYNKEWFENTAKELDNVNQNLRA